VERLQPGLPDRLAAGLAGAISAIVDPGQRVLALHEQLARVVGKGDLVLPLECLRTHVRLVIARVASRVPQPVGDLRFGLVNLDAQLGNICRQAIAHPGQLVLGPAFLSRPHRKRGSTVRRASRHLPPPQPGSAPGN
jgi:hypothetical protein